MPIKVKSVYFEQLKLPIATMRSLVCILATHEEAI